MSEYAAEPAPAPAPARSGGNPFTRKLGPLPVWAWMGIAMALALAYWYYKNKISGSTGSSGSSGTTNQNLVPEFVNQTYVNTTPPDNDGGGGGGGQPPERLRREWQASATASTLAQVAGRLGVMDPQKNLIPANAAAKKFMSETYPKNHNAKIPKGAQFFYYEGQVVPSSQAKLWRALASK